MSVSWPFVVNCDSKQAISFQEDTCPKSRIRGSFVLREDWVAEVRDQKIVQMSWIHGEKKCSDIMTKCMSTWKFRRMFKLVQDFSRDFWVKTGYWQVLSRMARPLFLGCTSIVLYVVVA